MSLTTQLLWNGLLVAGFGLQHSLLATLRIKRLANGKAGIGPLAWRSVESLVNVLYILIAASLWQYTDVVLWRADGWVEVLLYAGIAAAWLWYWQLHLFEYDCGLAFGSTTLVAQLARAPGPKLVPWKVGSRRWIRFPVHTAFFGMFFFVPTMTADLLVLAIVLNIYNVIGSILYDKRLLELAGDSYRPYVDRTGLILPPVYRAPKGAADLPMPEPRHWRQPAMHLPGVVVGVGLGALYYAVLGPNASTAVDMVKVGSVGLLGALLSGALLGWVLRPRAASWDQQQTDLSTTVALSAALGVASWVGIAWLLAGAPPAFAAYLPLWFTVQYLGHVVAFLTARRKWSASLAGEPADEAPAPRVPANV